MRTIQQTTNRFFTTLIIVILCPFTSSAYDFKEIRKGYTLQWLQPNIKYGFTMNHPDYLNATGVQQAIELSFEEWQKVDNFPLAFESQGYLVSGADGEILGLNVITWSYEEWTDQIDPIANTSVDFDPLSGEILRATITLNAHDFEWSLSGAKGKMDLRNILTHEIGHLLGLDHSNEPEATMWAYSAMGETKKRDLHPDDISGVQKLYENLTIDVTYPQTISGRKMDDMLYGCHHADTFGIPAPISHILQELLLLVAGAFSLVLWRVRPARSIRKNPHR